MNGKPSNHGFRILSHSDSVFRLFLEGLPRAIPQGALCLSENICFPTGQHQLWVDGGRSKSSNGGWCHDCLFYPDHHRGLNGYTTKMYDKRKLYFYESVSFAVRYSKKDIE